MHSRSSLVNNMFILRYRSVSATRAVLLAVDNTSMKYSAIHAYSQIISYGKNWQASVEPKNFSK